MLEFLHTYILTWHLPVALAIAALALWPIRNAGRLLRAGDWALINHGAVHQAFWATIWIGVAAFFYVYIAVLIIGVWIYFWTRHLLSAQAIAASLIACAIGAFWYGVGLYFQYL